jgi:hypothetical protein
MVERLVHHAEIINLKGDSYPLKTAARRSPANDQTVQVQPPLTTGASIGTG